MFMDISSCLCSKRDLEVAFAFLGGVSVLKRKHVEVCSEYSWALVMFGNQKEKLQGVFGWFMGLKRVQVKS